MEKIILGSEVSKEIKCSVKQKVERLISKGKKTPCLAVVIVGDDPASEVYVASKEKACREVLMTSKLIKLDKSTDQASLNKVIQTLNEDKNVNGILVQMPLPKHLNEDEVVMAIDPLKDVDGLHPYNIGLLQLNRERFVPCTPLGIMVLLDKIGVELAGKNAVVIGRSKLVGLPCAKLLEAKNCTVTVCHSKTKDIEAISKRADILVVAIGKALLVNQNWVKEGAVVIDVGINRVDGKVVGDVNLDDVIDKVHAITPVPKGVGPMTIAMLLENTLKAYHLQNGGQND